MDENYRRFKKYLVKIMNINIFKKNHETFLAFYIIFICSMTETLTNKVNNMLDTYLYKESSQ